MSDTKEEAEAQPGLQWNESVDTLFRLLGKSKGLLSFYY